MAKSTSPERDARGYDSRLMGRILRFLIPYKGWVAVAFILTMAAAFLGPLRPKLIQVAIDDYIFAGDADGLLIMVGWIFLAVIGEGILGFANGYLTQWIGQRAIFDLRVQVFRHLENLPLRFFDRTPLGRIITRTTSDVEALNQVLSAGVITILGNLFRLVFIAYFMMTLNIWLALVALAVMPLMVYATFLFRRKVREAYRETRLQVARLNSFLQEHITGMKIVQIFNREREEMRRYMSVNDDHRQVQIKTILYYAVFWPSVDLIASLALGLVIWFGGVWALGGGLTLGILVAFIQYVRQFFEPIRNLSDQYNMLQSAMAASERIFDLLDTQHPLEQPETPVVVEQFRGEIRFENVWFAYGNLPDSDEPNWVLRDVSFTVSPGQSVALVGATGSGKTTIINLLMRFYDIQKGRITVDGVNLRDYALADLRARIGLVLQDVFLFSGSVSHNIALGNPEISSEQIRAATAMMGINGFIEQLPEGYDHDVRERGASLSHGQRQLLSFARALVYNPDILVLDEATSSIDTETEHLIQHALEKLLQGRTSLVVAHRLSTIQHADQILVLHKGHLREQGTHQELLTLDGLYRRLYELQYREQEALA